MAELPASPSSVGSCTLPAGGGVVPLPCIVDKTIVEFRPKLTYQGEFGFDWLRVKEAPTTGPEAEPYIDNPGAIGSGSVNGGYKTPGTLTALEAQQKMKGTSPDSGEYKRVPIYRAATNFRHLVYYVPYLNLYPKNGLSFAVPTGTTPPLPAPPHSAELRMMIDVKDTAPEKVEIEFNPEYFEINGNRYITVAGKQKPYKYVIDNSNYTPTADSAGTSRDVKKAGVVDILKITCLKEFDSDQCIKVYAYPVGSSTKSEAEQIQVRKLAGQLIVCANNRANRRVQKAVLVRVRTNTAGTPTGVKTGFFNQIDIDYLYRVLYQALIYPDVYPKKLDGTQDIILDMSSDVEFTTTVTAGVTTHGKFVEPTNTAFLRLPTTLAAEGIPAYLRKKFLAVAGNAKYADYLTIFALDVPTPSAGGQADYDATADKFLKNVAIYQRRKDSAMAHEMVHGLGIFHTHRDGTVDKPNQKYVFPHASTDYSRATSNIMAYRDDGDRYSTWRWQWLIMKRNI